MKSFVLLRNLLLLFAFLPMAVSAYDVEIDGIYYNLNKENRTARVTSGDKKYNGDIIIPSNIIHNGDNYNVYYVEKYAFSGCSALTSVGISSSVKSIGNYAFELCGNLKTISLPIGLTEIADVTFFACSSLNNVTIPASVTRIGDNAFFGCSSLTSIVIPQKVSKICDGAFLGCDLKALIVCMVTPIEISENTFYKRENIVLYVPEGSLDAYRNADVWKDFKEIKAIGQSEADCDLSDLPTENAYYASTAFLCERGVLSGSKPDGKTNVNAPLKRAHLAKIAFRGLYSLNWNPVPETVPSDYYPTVYTDICEPTADNEYYRQAARALMYLEYGDGIAPFDRNRLNFEPENTISRLHTLKVLMETFNIKPNVAGTSNPFPDDADCVSLMTSNPAKFGYIRKAAALGIITTQNAQFRPNDDCLRGEAFVMLARIIQKIEAGVITAPEPTNDSYFEPLNTTLATISTGVATQMGSFNSYSKNSFALDGVMPLVFTHNYDSYYATLPEVFFGARTVNGVEETYRPLSAGWSHNYHSFITLVGSGSDARAIVHWGGAGINVYKSDGKKFIAESIGVYDDFKMDGYEAVIKTKSQMTYRFTNQGGTGAMVLYLSTITDRNGNTLTLNYTDGLNGTRNISSVSDGHRQLTFSYLSGTNLLEKVTDPLGRSIQFAYNYNEGIGEYMLSSFTDAKGQTTTYTYKNQFKGRDATSYTSDDWNSRSFSHLLTRIELPKGNYIENLYDDNCRLKETVDGVNGIPTVKTSIAVTANYRNGNTSTQSQVQVDNAGKTNTLQYSYNNNNAMAEFSGNNGVQLSCEYKDASHPLYATAITTNQGSLSGVQFDDRGNMIALTIGGTGGNGGYSKRMTYNDQNCLTSITDARGNTTTYTYDNRGNLTGITAPEGVNISMEVNGAGLTTSMTNAMGQTTKYTYNDYGNLTQTQDMALGLVTTTTYDNASRVTSSTDALERKQTYSYDDNDNLIEEQDAMGNVTKYGYDQNDNLVTITNAMGGVTEMTYDEATDLLTSLSFAGATKQYEYYSNGLLKTLVKPDGTTLNRTYDAQGHITDDGCGHRYTYDSNMRLAAIVGDFATLAFNYDGLGRIIQTRHQESGNDYQMDYEYDNNSNVTRLTYPTNNGERPAVSYTYDGLNRLTSLNGIVGKIRYAYRKDSKIERIDYDNIGMVTTFAYDAAGRLTEKKTRLKDGTVLASYTVTLDKVGNIVGQTTTEPIGRLPLANFGKSYTYDEGNRIKNVSDPTTNQFTNFSFDANGNATSRGDEKYVWTKQDKLARINNAGLIYDPMGNLTEFDGTKFQVEVSGNGNVLYDSRSDCNYVYGLGLEARVKDGHASYYVTDLRGSVVAIVNDEGKITHRYSYDEWGNIEQSEEADYNPFRFVGKWGVIYINDHCYYMRARMYDPTIGRFMSEDPIWSTNLYPYADNNPVMGIDPTGTITQSEYNKRYDHITKMIAKYTKEKDVAASEMSFYNHGKNTNYKQEYADAEKRRDKAWKNIEGWEKKMKELKESTTVDISGLGIRHDGVEPVKVDEEYMNLLLGKGGLTINRQQVQNGEYGLNLNSIKGINKMGDVELAIAEFFEENALRPYTNVVFKASKATDNAIYATVNGVKYVWNAAKKTWEVIAK